MKKHLVIGIVIVAVGTLLMFCSMCKAQTTQISDESFFSQPVVIDAAHEALYRALSARGEKIVVEELNKLAQGPSKWEKTFRPFWENIVWINLVCLTLVWIFIIWRLRKIRRNED